MRRALCVVLVLVGCIPRHGVGAPYPPAVEPYYLHLAEPKSKPAAEANPTPASSVAADPTPLVELRPIEFTDLVTRYEKAAQLLRDSEKPKPSPSPVGPTVFRRLELTARIDDQTAHINAKLDLTIAATGQAPLPILPANMAVLKFSSTDPGARLELRRTTEPALLYHPVLTGPHHIELDLAVPLQIDRSRRSLALSLPGCSAQHIQATIAPPVTGVTSTPEWLPLHTKLQKDGSVAVDLAAGSLRTLSLAWMAHPTAPTPVATPAPKPRETGPTGPRLFANVSTLHSIGDGIVRSFSWVNLVNSRDRIPSVEMTVPFNVSIRQVTGPLVKSFDVALRGNQKQIRVLFSESFRGRTTVNIAGETGIPQNGPTRLPSVAVPGAVRQHGVAGVSVFATYGVKFAKGTSSDVTAIDISELPAEVSMASASPMLLAFRLVSPSSQLAVDLTPFAPHRRIATAIQGMNAVTVLAAAPGDGHDSKKANLCAYTRLVMKVVDAGDQELRFSLPLHAQIDSCFVDLIPQVPAKLPPHGKIQTYLIPLKLSSVYENRLVPFPVEISYREDVPQPNRTFDKLPLNFPGLSAPVTDTTWTLYTPDGYRAVHVNGNFHELTTPNELLLVSYAETLFEVVIYQGGRLLFMLALLVGLPALIVRSILNRRKSGSSGWSSAAVNTLATIGIAGATCGVLASLAVPNFRAARERANTRACYANQKTIAGALEMYNLDKNTRRSDVGAGLLQTLTSGGYLQSIPNDPGEGGSNTCNNYQFTSGGNGMRCKVHGTIQGNS